MNLAQNVILLYFTRCTHANSPISKLSAFGLRIQLGSGEQHVGVAPDPCSAKNESRINMNQHIEKIRWPDSNKSIELIRWTDSVGLSSGWQDMEDALEIEPSIVVSVGTILREEEDYLVIASSWSAARQFGGVLAIPKASIVERRMLRKETLVTISNG